jgi:hypothetical protein
LPEPAYRRLRHRVEPLLDLPTRHRRSHVFEFLDEVVHRAVADPAGSALLARLLGEERHRHRE